MPLVDYSDSGSSSEEVHDEEPAPKRRKKADRTGVDPGSATESEMPPLPTGFFDLYASTVRQSTSDDPNLHQGRRRQTPHIVGNWPTHVYVEWIPTNSQHAVLLNLVRAIERQFKPKVTLNNFLVSDLGAPLPLHISLSRPISLQTSDKDDFLGKISRSLETKRVDSFAVSPSDLSWYRSPDSDRTFLILRVVSCPAGNDAGAMNPELVSLLTGCNNVVGKYGQPALYQGNRDGQVGTAFHISVGWTFEAPSEEMSMSVQQKFLDKAYSDVRLWKVDVSAIKVKIGNVVTHLLLEQGQAR